MGSFEVIQSILSILIGIFPWFFPSCPWYWKVIITLCVILISFLIYCFRLSSRIKTLDAQKADLSTRHTALSLRFDEKLKLEKRYEQAFSRLNIMLMIALQSSEEERLQHIYKAFIIEQNTLNEGGTHDESL